MKPIESFAGLRGILALWVLMGHLLLPERYGSIYNLGFATHADFGALGLLSILHFIAVDIFFLLSGYALSKRYYDHFTSASTGRSIDLFYWHRLWRIWPLHALMVAVIGLLAWLDIPHPITSGMQDTLFVHWQWTLLLNLLLMQGWGIIPVASWNEPAWTLSVTFLLYILFPNLVLMLRRIPHSPRAIMISIGLLIIGYGWFNYALNVGSHSDGVGGITRGFVFFIVGMLLARLNKSIPCTLGIGIFLAAIAIWTYMIQFPLFLLHLTYPLLILGLASSHHSIIPDKFAHWLSNLSFPLFLSHYPLLQILHYTIGEPLTIFSARGPLELAASYACVLFICLCTADLLGRADRYLHQKRTKA